MSNLNIDLPSSKPQVSVVIPMYNVAKYIELCINSVLEQSFTDFEIICVDDGCTDNTLDILATFTDPRIKLIIQANRGLPGARNTGMNAAKGQYIALLDSDDFWHQDKLKLHVEHLNKQQDVGISFCPSAFVDDDDKPLGIVQRPKLKDLSQRDIFCRNPIGNGSAPVIRKAMLIDYIYSAKSGGDTKSNPSRIEYFNEKLKQSEDIEFWTRLCLNSSWKFEGIPKALTFYRVNANGLSSNLTAQFESWKVAMVANQEQHPEFFAKYYELAKAYQYRYFARRSIQSEDAGKAWFYMQKAILTKFDILFEEPKRTINTFACCVLINILPKKYYKKLEQTIMQNLSKFNQTAKLA